MHRCLFLQASPAAEVSHVPLNPPPPFYEQFPARGALAALCLRPETAPDGPLAAATKAASTHHTKYPAQPATQGTSILARETLGAIWWRAPV